ncbi:hypothetical protein BOX37_26390 [Nocardia mangyaensis]|uniref:Uncharacterized protein n=2 Tax=Nocardia mangyaensis TaxID=2213200 RepID=A0A1J0VXT6_9NOCA|nr:hypothetical protein BOX37_26390 [Nocardia mangyaensis]
MPVAERFPSLHAYNLAYPHAPLPENRRAREQMRGFDAAGLGLEDDLLSSGALLTVEFLPGGAPGTGDLDRIGTVVATRWGQGPVYVLAESVSLRSAWKASVEQWPTTLSAALSVMAGLRRYTSTLPS